MKNVPHSSELLSQDEWRITGTSSVSPLSAHQDPNIALAVAGKKKPCDYMITNLHFAQISATDWAADFNINNVSATSGEPTPASAALAPYSSHMAKPYVPMPMGLGASQHMHKPSWNVQSSCKSSHTPPYSFIVQQANSMIQRSPLLLIVRPSQRTGLLHSRV